MLIRLDLELSDRIEQTSELKKVMELTTSVVPFTPEFWNTSEPVNRPFTGDTLTAVAAASGYWDFYWKRSKPTVNGWICCVPTSFVERDHAKIAVDVSDEKLTGSQLMLSDRICNEFNTDFGCLHRVGLGEVERGLASGALLTSGNKRVTYWVNLATWKLKRNLPDLYWTTIFGKPYIDLFGREKLLSAPAHSVVELEGGCIRMQLTPGIDDIDRDYDNFEAVRATVKQHLNPNAFFQLDLPKDHVYDAPDFGF